LAVKKSPSLQLRRLRAAVNSGSTQQQKPELNQSFKIKTLRLGDLAVKIEHKFNELNTQMKQIITSFLKSIGRKKRQTTAAVGSSALGSGSKQ
jgi:hypothetical protein